MPGARTDGRPTAGAGRTPESAAGRPDRRTPRPPAAGSLPRTAHGRLIVAAVLPIAIFGAIVMAAGALLRRQGHGLAADRRRRGGSLLWAAGRGVAVAGLNCPSAPYHRAVERVAAGNRAAIHISGDDELARLARATTNRRRGGPTQRRAGRASASDRRLRPERARRRLTARAASDACAIYGLIDCDIASPIRQPSPWRKHPGRPAPVRADVRAAARTLGLLTAICRDPGLGACRSGSARSLRQESAWPCATPSCSARSRARTPGCSNSTQPRTSFLRGVSHNLQTPYKHSGLRRTTRAASDEPWRIIAWRSSPSRPIA